MEKEPAILLTDGSLESAVLCAIARQQHEVILADVSPPGDAAATEAVARQIDYLRPRHTHPLGQEPAATDPSGLFTWTRALAAAAPLVRQHRAAALYVPLRAGESSALFGQAGEWVQIWEELLRHGLELGEVRLLAPLLELESWQVADLSDQMQAPATAAHGEANHEAFVRAGRPRPQATGA